jgi:Meiotically up-regulated gene 113
VRDQILSEIKRLADANGGQPPGRDVFERETGIRPGAWMGRYWARWGDAIKEAGYTPNSLQSKADSNTILSKLAEATRAYGKMPTSGELRLYARRDPTFPSHSSLWNHFANKPEMVARLREWVSANPAFKDVAALLPEPDEKLPSLTKRVTEGLVYLIKSGAHYKIGRSDELERRVKEIRIALPEAASLVHSIRTDDPAGIEAYWHRRFADRRANGEWFKLTNADVSAFKRRKYQ